MNQEEYESYNKLFSSSEDENVKTEWTIRVNNYFYEPEIIEGRFTCPKCKCKKISVSTAQTRSGDEGQTSFLACTNKMCMFKWKFG